MSQAEGASRYARALMGLLDHPSDYETMEQALGAFLNALNSRPEIYKLLVSPSVSMKEREQFLDQTFSKTLPPLLLRFIKVITRKKRIGWLEGIRRELHRLCQKKRGIAEVEVVTAIQLSQDLESQLAKALGRKLKAEIRLKKFQDPQLIGGMILRFEGKQIDSSFKTRLTELSQNLLS